MKFLLDSRAKQYIELQESHGEFIGGQLLTPLTRFAYLGHAFAIDNGAYSGFKADAFKSLLFRQNEHREHCLFVVCPNVVGSSRRTLEIFNEFACQLERWPVALAAQDGVDDLPIPWRLIEAIFIGGSTEWKMSKSALDVCKTARILGKHVHVGRVNTIARFRHFKDHADTCDGSGVSRFGWMLQAIADGENKDRPLLDGPDKLGEVMCAKRHLQRMLAEARDEICDLEAEIKRLGCVEKESYLDGYHNGLENSRNSVPEGDGAE